jgi:hypothetical protein
MASCSSAQIGALNAESYCERVISASNLILNKGNTNMKDELIEMLVVLRMNREFMVFVRAHYLVDIAKRMNRPKEDLTPTIVREDAPVLSSSSSSAIDTDEEESEEDISDADDEIELLSFM